MARGFHGLSLIYFYNMESWTLSLAFFYATKTLSIYKPSWQIKSQSLLFFFNFDYEP